MTVHHLTRRTFVGCCACLTASVAAGQDEDPVGEEPHMPRLYDPIAPEEQERFDESPLVREILNAQGCSCAESALLAALRYLDRSEELLDCAAVFGGGMGQADLCGFLTGSLMALGAAAGAHHQDRKTMKRRARKMADEFWTWWQSMAPLHCRELRPLYDNDGYVRMKQRVAAKLQELIDQDAQPAEPEDA